MNLRNLQTKFYFYKILSKITVKLIFKDKKGTSLTKII